MDRETTKKLSDLSNELGAPGIDRLFRSARARLAERLLRGPGRVLDIGCGRGVFLEILRGRGHAVRGTELSEATAANALPGIPVDPGEVRAGRYAPESFDLISIWHVLEHDQRPDEVLRACHEFLVPGGALMIAVPNFASVQARIGRELWFHLDLPRHIFQFTPTTLKRLLAESGYEIERCSTGQWEMDPFGLLQTALNRLGLRPNAMYDSLRTNRAVQRDLSPLYRAAMLLLCPLGMLLALPISGVLRIAGRAGTIIAVARKPAA